jgi:lipopolysaccharide transport system ATP-binding protein
MLHPPNALSSSEMDTDLIAVRVNHVSKIYHLWDSPRDRLIHPLRRVVNSILPSSFRKANGQPQGYRLFHALHDVSFEIKKGESWGFIGVNGSGKSTLLKTISGNLRPSTGTVEVDGKVAILDYGSGFNGDFTGRENIFLKGALLGLSKKQLDERLQTIMEFADIGEFIDQPVKTYSSGMSARLGFAIMAHVDADILITDEALAVGDAFFVQKCMSHIRNFLKRGTFLFVSHSVNDVVALCQKAVWLEQGRVRAIGTAKEVTEAYLSSALIKNSRKLLIDDSAPTQPIEPAANEVVSNSENMLAQPRLSELACSRPPRVIKDPRLEYLNRSPWRNDIQIPVFDPDSHGFGVGGAKIEEVVFEDDNGAVLSWVIGAEMVHLKIDVRAERDLQSPIVGFQVKDRLGQSLFADNTFFITIEKPFVVKAGQRYQADFFFQMPLLPPGEYVIRTATALGSEETQVIMMHCIDNALIFRSTTSGARHGLVGVPMHQIKIQVSL